MTAKLGKDIADLYDLDRPNGQYHMLRAAIREYLEAGGTWAGVLGAVLARANLEHAELVQDALIEPRFFEAFRNQDTLNRLIAHEPEYHQRVADERDVRAYTK